MITPNQPENAAGTALAAATRKPQTIGDLLKSPANQEKLQAVLSGGLDPKKFVRTCMAALQKTPALQQCDPLSVFGAMMTSASLGLEPNTPLQQAFLIPYKNKRPIKDDTGKTQWIEHYECQFQIGYRGFVKLAYDSATLIDLQAEAIHENDTFEHEQGSKTFLTYRKTLKARGDLVGAFCYLRVARANGETGQVVCVLPLEEIEKIRSKSQTYNSLKAAIGYAKNEAETKKAEQKLAETPWVQWQDDMAAKSAIKKIIKQFPLSPLVQAAAALDDLADGGKLDLRAMGNAEVVRDAVDGGGAPILENEPQDEVIPNTATTNTAAPQPVAVAAVATVAAQPAQQQAAVTAVPNDNQQAAPMVAAAIPTNSPVNFGD